MKMHSVEKTFYYIDPSAATSGDGSSAQNANKTFPETLENDKIYLVRRTSFNKDNENTYAIFPNGEFNCESVVIMGMPKNLDPEYDWIPTDAKNIWGNDEADYANIRFDEGSYHDGEKWVYKFVKFNSCKNFRMTRIMFLANNIGDYDRYFSLEFYNYPSYYLKNCYFRYFPWTVINSGDSCPHFNNFPLGYIWGMNRTNDKYIYTKGYSFFISDCIIEKNCQEDAFTFYGFHDIILKNLEIYNVQGRPTSTFSFTDNYRGCNFSAENINCYYSFLGCDNSYFDLPTAIYVYRANHAKVTNFTAIKYSGSTVTPSSNRVICQPVINITTVASGSEINNVTINFPFTRLIGNSLIRLIQMNGYRDNYTKVPESSQFFKVSNIRITTADTPDGVYNEGRNTAQNMFTNSDNVGALFMDVDNTNNSADHHNVSETFLVQNLVLNCNSGVALFARKAILDLAEATIYGCVNLGFCTGKIKKISSWMCGYILKDAEQNFLYIEEIYSNKNNPSYNYNANPALVTDWSSNILCNKCNIKFMPEDYLNRTIDSAYECEYVCTSEITEGNYVVRNRLAKAQTWSINREGSSTGCSLKLTNTVRDDHRFPLRIGGEPFRGVKFEVPNGKKILKFYCCVVGYNNTAEIKDRLQCKVILPDGQVIYSEEGSWKADDPDAWNDIDENTNFVFELPINSSTSGDGYIEYMFNWCQNETALYLDPFPEIVSIS